MKNLFSFLLSLTFIILFSSMFEFVNGQTIRYLTSDGAGSKDGLSWANAYAGTSLQAAITASAVNDQVWVAAGTYKPTTTTDRFVCFTMKNGVAVYGGFAGTETMLSQRNWVTNVTILSGDIGIVSSTADNSYHVVYNELNNNTAILDGFTITEGNANGSSSYTYGGGVYNYSSSPSLFNCTISGNTASENGGGVYNTSSSPTLTNCTVSGNSATSGGGGMYNYSSSSPTLINCLISRNSSYNGGGLFNLSSSSPTLTNCTVSGNSATGSGGGLYNQTSSSSTINNSIIWGNTSMALGKQIYIESGSSSATLNYSCYSNGSNDIYGTITATNNDITINPQFINPNNDFRIANTSQCADAGNDAYNTETNDIRGPGFGRKLLKTDAAQTGTIDMGAYEYKFGTDPAEPVLLRIYVKADASGFNDGTSWENAYTSLQSALNAERYYEIWVAAGTYYPTIGSDRTISFRMKSNMAVYGGFAGTETSLSQRNWATNVTILSGDIGTVGSSSDNSYHVVYSQTERNDATAILNGFTIIGGKANGSNPHDSGGGVYNYNYSGAILTNCTITGNSASDSGGGVYNTNSSSTTLTNCIISENSAVEGGGVYNFGAQSSSLINCTISGNSATYGGGIYNLLSSTTNNSIIWGNTATGGKQVYNQTGTTTLNFCCYSNGSGDIYNGGTFTPAANCTTMNPKFINAASSNFRIYGNSPCVNTGNNDYNANTYDIRKQLRIQNTVIDMGAYEWTTSVDPAAASLIWTGSSSTDWNIPANWDLGFVPAATDNATIPNVTNKPVVNEASGSPAVCNNLTIESGAVLTIAAGKAITVNGTLTNNSTGGVVIQSDATGTGSLITGSAGGTGSATAQSWMTAGAWHIVSSPLSGQTVANFLAANADIPTKTGKRGMMDYDPVGNAWNSFFTNGTGNGSLGAGRGFSMRVDASDAAVTFAGSLQVGSQPTTTSASYWNCIGNPYTSAIRITHNTSLTDNFLDVNAANFTPSYGAIYIWNKPDASNGFYGNYTVVSNSTPLFDDVQQCQAFMVNAVAGTFSFTSAMQIHDATLALKSTKEVWPTIKLLATIGLQKSSTIIAFNSEMTKGLDVTYDAGLLKGASDLIVYTKLVQDNGIPFAIQALPDNDYSNMIIPIGLDFKTGGDVVFSAETSNLSADCSVILEDKLFKKFTDLSQNDYTATIAANSSITDRFRLHTSSQTTGSNLTENLAGKLSAYAIRNTEIRLKGEVSKQAIATLYDIQGRIVLIKNLEAGILNIIPTPNIRSGIYMLFVKDNDQMQGFKIPVTE